MFKGGGGLKWPQKWDIRGGVKNDKDEDDGTNSDLNNTQSKPRLMRIPLMQNSTCARFGYNPQIFT